MRGFNVLDPNLPLFESHFLEASAGTGKTFAIENLVSRLLDEGVPLEEILVVTFTRAATVELKERIRAHLSAEQLLHFDEAKIWTIHSFCFHSLQEHALQTGFLLDQEEESAQIELLKRIVKDGLRSSRSLTPKQLEKVLNERLVDRLAGVVSQRLPIEQPDWTFPRFALEPDKVFEDLLALAPQYGKLCDRKKQVKPEVEAGLRRFTAWLAGEPVDPVDLPILNFTEENKLKRAHTAQLHNPRLLETFQKELIPKLASFSDPLAIFAVLAEEVRKHLERVVEEEELFFFEDLLRVMAAKVREPSFAECVRKSYRAVLIDEFQDTDPLQWEIFSTLFLAPAFKGPVYLVGDPKQSIYRFRSADLYTYLKAKNQMGEKTHASLQTNYRSAPALVEELNRLFSRDFIQLPKTGETLPCLPVEAASAVAPIEDGKGAIHFLYAEEEAALFSTIVHEIARLNLPLKECAVLVSDRFQAERFIQACPLPTVNKKSRSLLESPAFETLLELIRAVQNPRDASACARVLGGPLFRYPLDALPEAHEQFYRYRHTLETEGLLALFYQLADDAPLDDGALYQDLLQLVEMGVHIKEDYLTFYQGLMRLDPDSEQLKARAGADEEAVQVMTIHVSKGLEFSVVFPIGIATPYSTRKGLIRSQGKLVFSDPLSEAEERAEKMRQLYVACTRAKQRLYIPVLPNTSPVTTFLEPLDVTAYSSEHCQLYPAPAFAPNRPKLRPKPVLDKTFSPCAIHSYSSLAHFEVEKKTFPEGILPPGPETGTLIHQLFENYPFGTKLPLAGYVREALHGTFLEPWESEAAEMMQWALNHPLPAEIPFSLSEVSAHKISKEMEFLYPSEEPPGFLKGFIDLVCEHEGGTYILDWKTNWIASSVEEEVKAHHYALQAEIYQKALERYLCLFPSAAPVKGIFYLFLRPREVYSFFMKN